MISFITSSNKLLRSAYSSPLRRSVLFTSCNYSTTQANKLLRLDTLPKNVLTTEYAVRGELVMRAEQHATTLALSAQNRQKNPLPFDEITFCNIGNPHSLKQKPLTFFRQILSLCEYPELIKNPNVDKLYPRDVLERAKKILEKIPGGVGAYTHSQGFPFVRASIANFIQQRDGYPSDPDSIFIYNGASPGIQHVMRLLIRDENDGILIPIPQYPLYSASIALLGGKQLGYYLNESASWGLSMSGLQKSLTTAKERGVIPRALVIINPGNPTGQVLDIQNMKEVIEFCHSNKLILMADEVYQENVYIKSDRPFNSFKKVLRSMGSAYDNFELFSFHSISKGMVGECGHRGGYLEAVGIDPAVKAQLYKLASILLCPNTSGQLLLNVMVDPPKSGDDSFSLYVQERDSIYESLKRRATKLSTFFNTLEGVTCNPAQGAMYLFPQIRLPKKAVTAAQTAGRTPDTFYAIAMLDATGICVVPGSGFGQEDGTFHFRTTFLPQEDQIDKVMNKMSKFHAEFMNHYRD